MAWADVTPVEGIWELNQGDGGVEFINNDSHGVPPAVELHVICCNYSIDLD